MGIKINYQNYYPKKIKSYKKMFKMIADYVFTTVVKEGNYELSVSIVDDDSIHKYNKEYRNIDRPTDVLSFAFLDAEENIFDSKLPIELGDILISYDTMLRQKDEYGHSIEREIGFLFTHGLLHLLGYDHINKEDEKEMFSLQNEILEGLSITR